MAKSKIMGAFGALRGSIGSVTYSTLNTNRAGQRVQVARQKATQVSNPNSVAQILQRMKLTPAQRFYEAFEKVVAKGIMSHSWEGVSYGNASRQEFMSRAMKNEAAVFVPKGYNAFAPGEYDVSAGSLPSWNWRNDLGDGDVPTENSFLAITDSMTDATVQKALALGLELGDQITVIGAIEQSGLYSPFAARIIVGVGNDWERSADTPGDGLYITQTGIVYDNDTVNQKKLAAVAVIVSRGQDSSTAKRSSAQMLLLGEYKNLISADAMNAAIASYENGEAVTSLGSDWYLNNTPLAGQAVAGTVKTLEVTVKRVEGQPTSMTRPFAVVERVSNGQIGYVVLTENGASDGISYTPTENAGELGEASWPDEAHVSVTGVEVTRGIVDAGLNSLGYAQMNDAIAAQGGYTTV